MNLLTTSVLYIDDHEANLEVFSRLFNGEVQVHLALNTAKAREILKRNEIHLIITDQRMPGETGLEFIARISEEYPLCAKVVLTAYSDRHVMRQAFQSNKIMDFILKPYEEEDLIEVFKRGRSLYEENLRQAKMAQHYDTLRRDLKQDHGSFKEMIGSDRGLKPLTDRLRKVACVSQDSTVLIQGESGTGKELIARAIHFNSSRRNGPFIAVHCAALPETLWEAELFGYERGAFSGAQKRKLGRFELADKGTLFLDEVGEIPEILQVKLLRVLQERTIERLGGVQSIPIDARIISATNRSLIEQVQIGRFRQDLFFRLNVVPINVPSLREHPEDIPDLVEHFLAIANQKTGKSCRIDSLILDQLQSYEWPGNVRELEHLIERAVILSDGDMLNLSDFKVDLEGPSSSPDRQLLSTCGKAAWEEAEPGASGENFRIEIKRQEIDQYKSALLQAQGNISEAARILGIHRRTLTDRLRKLELI